MTDVKGNVDHCVRCGECRRYRYSPDESMLPVIPLDQKENNNNNNKINKK